MTETKKTVQVAKNISESTQGTKTVADYTITNYKTADCLTKDELYQLLCKDIAYKRKGDTYTYTVEYDEIRDCMWLVFNLLPERKRDFRIQLGVVMKQLFEGNKCFETLIADANHPDKPIYLYLQADGENLESLNRRLATDDLFRRTFHSASNVVDNMFNSVER